jgi:hypothetical protein
MAQKIKANMKAQHSEEDHPFYGIEIIRRKESDYINNLLKKYKDCVVSDDLQMRIWDELQAEKYAGRVTIPFKVVMRKDVYRKYPDTIEVILDTKV